MAAIEINDLTKIIKNNTVLDHIDLKLEEQGIYGFYGHNGSGKTMLFRAVAGIIKPTSGYVAVWGKRVGDEIAFPGDMGIMIESVGMWSYYTGFENLKALASIRRVIGDSEIKEVIARVGLDPKDKKKYGKYSLGMKQRLAVAQAVWNTRACFCSTSRQTRSTQRESGWCGISF